MTKMDLLQAVEPVFEILEDLASRPLSEPRTLEVGTVLSASPSIASVSGLDRLGLEELVRFENGELGIAITLEPDRVGVAMLDSGVGVAAGTPVYRRGTPLKVPVGPELLGRVVDGAGRPLDGRGPVITTTARDADSAAPPIIERGAVDQPLQTGIKVIDALIPIGLGQRELLVGERQTGKTSIAVDTILNQRGKGIACIYCAIGQRDSAVTRVLGELERWGALEYTCLVVAGAEDPPGLQYVAPFTATAIAEDFLQRGQDAFVVYDDLSAHALAYRELSLLLRRPPGREAYPGDVFYLHSRLLERATRLREDLGGGSLTALPICTLESDDLSSYIPTNLISITDGQIVLSARLSQKGQLPAVDVGRSVSRVGSDAQLPAYREFLADLKLEYAQYEELEAFARFDTRLSEQTLQILERGRKVRAVFRQPPSALLDASSQIAVFRGVTAGALDTLSEQQIPQWQENLIRLLDEKGAEIRLAVQQRERLSAEHHTLLDALIAEAVEETLKRA